MITIKPLSDFLSEYVDRNIENKYPPVAVGRYGIRTRESIYSKELAKDYSKNKLIRKNTLTVGMGSNQVDIGILSDDKIYSVSPAYHTYNINGINVDYLRYCLEHRNQDMFIRYAKRGSRQGKTIDFSRWLNYVIPVYSEEIQSKIVIKLNKISFIIRKREELLKLYDQLVRSLFIEMFGDIHNNKNYDYTNIEEITSVLSGGTPDRKENKYWEGGTINWVKTTELNNNIIIETEEKITNLGLENSSAKIIPPQSILIAMYGQGKTRGMTGYLEVSSATNQACACILPSRYINQKYLWNYLILSYDKLRSMAKGGNQPNLNVMIIKKFPVLIPPINLQEKFVQSVSSIDKSKFSSFSHLSA